MAFHDAVSPSTLTSLARILCQGDAQHGEDELDDLDKLERFGDVDAGQRAGEPVDQPGLEVRAEVGGEVLEAELGGVYQVADKGQRVLQDALQARRRSS